MSGLSREDRARLEAHTTGAYRPDCPPYYCELCDDCEAALTRALALIDQQEKALEAADRLAEFAEDDAVSRAIVATGARAYRSARATSTKESNADAG